jgi:hypothetical protein
MADISPGGSRFHRHDRGPALIDRLDERAVTELLDPARSSVTGR